MFRLTISQLGVLLGKSAATIRSWERKGLVTLPRVGTSRVVSPAEALCVADMAYEMGRISGDRLRAVAEFASLLHLIENGDL